MHLKNAVHFINFCNEIRGILRVLCCILYSVSFHIGVHSVPDTGAERSLMITWTFADVDHTRRWLRLGYSLVSILATDYPEQSKKLEEILDTVQEIVETEAENIPF